MCYIKSINLLLNTSWNAFSYSGHHQVTFLKSQCLLLNKYPVSLGVNRCRNLARLYLGALWLEPFAWLSKSREELLLPPLPPPTEKQQSIYSVLECREGRHPWCYLIIIDPYLIIVYYLQSLLSHLFRKKKKIYMFKPSYLCWFKFNK